MGIGVRGLGQVHLPVADIHRAVAFYRDVLGLPLVLDVPAQRMAFLGLGGTRLYLGEAEGAAPEPEPEPEDDAEETDDTQELADEPAIGGVILYLDVADIAAAWAALPDETARLAPPHLVHRQTGSELWIAFLADPDGHPLGLMEERAV